VTVELWKILQKTQFYNYWTSFHWTLPKHNDGIRLPISNWEKTLYCDSDSFNI